MSTYLDPALEIHRLFQQPEGGIVGVTDRLLQKCREHRIQLEWCESGLRIQVDDGPAHILQGSTLRKSVFRALLARIATLSKDAGSLCSPYGDSGEVLIAGDRAVTIAADWVNTPDQQQVALWPVKSE